MKYHVTRCTISPTTDDTLPWYDYSTLNEIDQCNRKGALLYIAKKQMPFVGREVALEAGTVVHEFCAAWNGWMLPPQELERVFGTTRFTEMQNICEQSPGIDDINRRLLFALSTIHTSDYYDEPNNDRRTIKNIEEVCRHWSMLQTKEHDIVAVEMPFDMTISIEYTTSKLVHGSRPMPVTHMESRELTFRYVGRIDLVKYNVHGELLPLDYKTTGLYINETYWIQHLLSPQTTGYQMALRCLYPDGAIANYVEVEALRIPLIKSGTTPSTERRPFERGPSHIQHFLDFCIRNIEIAQCYASEPWNAPMRHSYCNAYMKPCQFVELCVNPVEEDRESIVKEQMTDRNWDPLRKE
jgi:hypothetical protein